MDNERRDAEFKYLLSKIKDRKVDASNNFIAIGVICEKLEELFERVEVLEKEDEDMEESK